MKISVVIIAYNLENYIAEAIESVLNQTRAASEIIVVNDCSTDSTERVILKYANRVTYLKMPVNSGASKTALFGIQHTTGDIVAMLDGDDLWDKQKIELIATEYEQDEDLGLLSHDYVRVNARGDDMKLAPDETQINIKRILARHPSDKHRQSEDFKDSVLGKKGYWLGSAYSFRKKFLDIKLFSEFIDQNEDVNYTYLDLIVAPWLILNNPGMVVGYIPRVLFYYRIHGANSCSDYTSIQTALKAVKRGNSVTQMTYEMILKHKEYGKYEKIQRQHLKQYTYLKNLYENRKLKSFVLFIQLTFALWNFKTITKELIRLSTVVLLGPQQFLILKNKRVNP